MKVFTTNTTLEEKEKKLEAKISAKYAHPLGFNLDKFEVSPKGKVAMETSLVDAAPGLKLAFNGNDADKGDLSFTYSPPHSTITGEIDLLNFSKANTSVAVSSGPFVGGAVVDLTFAKSAIDTTKFGFGVGYTVPKSLFAGFRVANSLNEYSGIFSYVLSKEFTLAGKVLYTASGKSAGTTSTVAGIYQLSPETILKFKTTSAGVISASIKQALENKFSVVGSVEIPSGFTSGFKFGINATLG